jgi:hypothetical protein
VLECVGGVFDDLGFCRGPAWEAGPARVLGCPAAPLHLDGGALRVGLPNGMQRGLLTGWGRCKWLVEVPSQMAHLQVPTRCL